MELRVYDALSVGECDVSLLLIWLIICHDLLLDPCAAEFGRRRRRVSYVSRKRNSARPASPTAVHRRRRRIWNFPPSLISFFITKNSVSQTSKQPDCLKINRIDLTDPSWCWNFQKVPPSNAPRVHPVDSEYISCRRRLVDRSDVITTTNQPGNSKGEHVRAVEIMPVVYSQPTTPLGPQSQFPFQSS